VTNLMISLRRSPRTLLERDGHPGPGAGRLALVMARAGVGKTAFLVGIGLDALLSDQKVLHVSLDRSVDKVRDWYDDLLMEMLRRERQMPHWNALQVEMERRRHIHTYVGQSFTVGRLRQALEVIGQAMDFVPNVIILDRMELGDMATESIAELVDLAREVGAELWMACRTHREDPPTVAGHLPAPADRFEHLVDMAFRLDPENTRIRLHVLKDREQMLDDDLNIILDPQTLLLTSGVATRR
jgi:hypothetical protein